jgi:desampylase
LEGRSNQGTTDGAVALSRVVAEQIVAQARDASPVECCGLLVGTGSRIVEAIPAANVADSPATRFLIDPKDHIDARREARMRGLDVIGFYHSHPHSPAQPSARDRSEASYPDHLYLIVSLAVEPAEFSIFVPGDGTFRDRALTID